MTIREIITRVAGSDYKFVDLDPAILNEMAEAEVQEAMLTGVDDRDGRFFIYRLPIAKLQRVGDADTAVPADVAGIADTGGAAGNAVPAAEVRGKYRDVQAGEAAREALREQIAKDINAILAMDMREPEQATVDKLVDYILSGKIATA